MAGHKRTASGKASHCILHSLEFLEAHRYIDLSVFYNLRWDKHQGHNIPVYTRVCICMYIVSIPWPTVTAKLWSNTTLHFLPPVRLRSISTKETGRISGEKTGDIFGKLTEKSGRPQDHVQYKSITCGRAWRERPDSHQALVNQSFLYPLIYNVIPRINHSLTAVLTPLTHYMNVIRVREDSCVWFDGCHGWWGGGEHCTAPHYITGVCRVN